MTAVQGSRYPIETLIASLPDIACSSDPVQIRRKSRDQFGISPLLRQMLAGKTADAVVSPRTLDEVVATAAGGRPAAHSHHGARRRHGELRPERSTARRHHARYVRLFRRAGGAAGHGARPRPARCSARSTTPLGRSAGNCGCIRRHGIPRRSRGTWPAVRVGRDPSPGACWPIAATSPRHRSSRWRRRLVCWNCADPTRNSFTIPTAPPGSLRKSK